MVPALKAEFKKLLTVRSTYILTALVVVIVGLFTYFGTSQTVIESDVKPQSAEQAAPPPDAKQQLNTTRVVSKELPKEALVTHFQDKIPVVALLTAIVVVLLMGHEFRYNTITYTLTASNSRSKVLGSKVIVSTAYALFVALLAMGVMAASAYIAIHVKGLYLPPQDFPWGMIILRQASYVLGFSLMALAFITLARNLIAGIVAIFLLPTIDAVVGQLLSNWQIEATKVLPYSALNRVGNVLTDYVPAYRASDSGTGAMIPATALGAAGVFALYLVGIWLVSWYLFLKRDAS
jgi:ABC-type transport system involved in multi-copper enzyme maturation permease subunit